MNSPLLPLSNIGSAWVKITTAAINQHSYNIPPGPAARID